MAIIYNYKLATPDNNDLLLGTDINDFNLTKSFKISDLANLISSQVVESIPQTIPVTGTDDNLTDSIITQSGDNTSVTIHGDLYVNETLYVSNFSVTGLTKDRVVFVGDDGRLVDSPNLTFNGTTVGLTGGLTASANSTFNSDVSVTGTMSSGILAVTGVASIGNVLTMGGNINMDTNSIINAADPTTAQGVATKNYVDNLFSTGSGTVSGTGTTNNIVLWSDGPNGVISDSIIAQNATTIKITGALESTLTTSLSTTGGVVNIGSLSNSQNITSLNFLSSVTNNVAIVSNQSVGGILKFQTNTNSDRLTINSDGSLILNDYGQGSFTGTEAYTLGVDSSGNIIELTPPTPGAGNGTVYEIVAGVGLDGGTITTQGIIDLADTLVTPGSYTLANITVDQQGRITSASSGTAGAGTVQSVTLDLGTTGVDLNVVNGTITQSGTITLNVPNATSNSRGVLTSTDWSNFNSKQDALTLGNLTENTSNVLSFTGNTSAIVGGGLTIEVTQATTSADGYLSAVDFTTFESKQDQITLTTSGDSGAATFSNNTLNIPDYSTATPSLATTDLTDVSSTQPQNNQTLIFDSSLGYYVPSFAGSGTITGSGTTTEVAIFDSSNSITSDSAISINSSSQIIMDVLRGSASYADDTEALAAGVPYGGLYRTGSIVKINLLSPTPSPGEVQIGNLIWTDANSSIVESSSGTIPILTTQQQLADAYANSTAGAVYYDLDPANAGRGLLYNQTAAATITPPTGFRLPTINDWNNLVTELEAISGSINDVTPGGGGSNALWNQTIKSNTNYGASGFNSIKAGLAAYSGTSISFFADNETWWKAEGITGTKQGKTFSEQSNFILRADSTSGYPYWFIRFCKDA